MSDPPLGFWGSVFGFFKDTVPKVKTPIQLAAFVTAAVGVMAIHRYSPDSIVMQAVIGFFGVVIVVVAQIPPNLARFPEHQRLASVLAPLVVFMLVFLIVLVIVVVHDVVTSERAVGVSLQHNRRLLERPFTIRYLIPGRTEQREEGKNGHALITGVPSRASTLHITNVQCDGFTPKDTGIFDIVGGTIVIAMREDGPSDPWSPPQFPDPSQYVPSEDVVAQPPAVAPDKVLFQYVNHTGDPLTLVLYNCSLHYPGDRRISEQMKRWITRPFPADSGPQPFQSLPEGSTGWFVIFVKSNDKCFHICTANLFDDENPTLVVERTNSTREPYRGDLSFPEDSSK